MGFTAIYGNYSFYCTVNGEYTLTKQHALNSYEISFCIYWYIKKNDADAMWAKKQQMVFAAIPADIFTVIYAKVKSDFNPDYQLVDDL